MVLWSGCWLVELLLPDYAGLGIMLITSSFEQNIIVSYSNLKKLKFSNDLPTSENYLPANPENND